MEHVTSADGTLIAMHEVGGGPSVVIVNGALSTARDAAEIARAFADVGLRAITYDRRARGDSGDSETAAPEREVEDLAAVIAASGPDTAVIGHSSGAVLALFAAGRGVPMSRLCLSEPPLRFGEDEPAADLEERLQALVDDGHPEEAVVLFQREAVGLTEAFIEQFRASPAFDQIAPLGRSTVYDVMVTRRASTPSVEMREVRIPVTIVCGVETMPMLVTAASRLSEAMPDAELVQVPESVGHRMDPEATARIVAARMG
jgi:pimeloyl-ACP methyl ester carboxylesterase